MVEEERTSDRFDGLPRAYLRASLVLLIGESSAHGYDLLEQIRHLGLVHVDPGGLYRALRLIERDGLALSHWEHSGAGPARRTYQLTAAGREWLRSWASALAESHHYVGEYLDRYAQAAGSLAAVDTEGA